MIYPTAPLPVRLTPFVGRQDDLKKILNLIENPSVRLVTILGTGGIGKTRLAIELTRILQERFRHGAVFVPLAQLSTIDELLPALAGAMGVQSPPGGDLQHAVLEHLANQQILLVLDNFEHLLEESTLVCDILVRSPRVKVLVTSREKLNLEAEALYHLGGLQLPSEDSLEKAQEYDAVQLFLQKAGQVRPGFALNTANAPAVIRICHLVDGNPLGILLAAAWLEHFSPAEIAGEISLSLDFLSREVRDAEPRHRGMRAVFDSSFNCLEEYLQTVFRKLSVFRGGFDLPAAQSVAHADLRALIALLEKSLLTRNLDTGRYELHELLRQYAGERLAIAGDRETTLTAYVDHYIDFVRQREWQLKSHSQTKALDEIHADFDNIRQACSWMIEKRDFYSARAVLPGLYAFCDMRSRFYEGEALFRLAVEGLAPRAGETPHPAWALALLSWYDMRMYIERLESFEEIESKAQSCLEGARKMCDLQATAASLVLLGAIAGYRSDFKTAIRYYREGMESYPSLDNVYWVNMRIGLCHQSLQDCSHAIQAFRTSLQRGKETGERVKMGWSLLNIGDTLLLQGEPAEAERHLREALDLFQEVGTTVGVLWSNYSLSRVAVALCNPTLGRELAQTAAQIAQQIHSASWIAKTDDLLHLIDPQYARACHETNNRGDEPFSQRELEVLQLLRSDLNGPAIAQTLVVSLNTVRYHTKNIYRKLGAGTRLEAIQRAKELGL